MALIKTSEVNKYIVTVIYSALMAIPLIGLPFVVGFGLKTIHCALTRTDKKINVLYAIVAFIGFWLLVWGCQFLPSKLQMGDDGLGTIVSVGFVYSIIWFLLMESKVNLFKPNAVE